MKSLALRPVVREAFRRRFSFSSMTDDGFSSPAVTLNETRRVNKPPYDSECSSERRLNENRYVVSKPPPLRKVFKFKFLVHSSCGTKDFPFMKENVVGA